MFKKLKAFYKRNRVYSILMIISIICIIAVIVGVATYFLRQTSKDKYGDRLEGIEKVAISKEKIKSIEDHVATNEIVDSTEIDIEGKIVYITIEVNGGTHADIDAIAQDSLTQFSDDEKAFYDIHYTIDKKNITTGEIYPYMGSLKAGNTMIKWTNHGD